MTAAAETAPDEDLDSAKTIQEYWPRLARASEAAYLRSPFSALSRDFFSRFSRDPDARPRDDEVQIDRSWTINLPAAASECAQLMAEHLRDFLARPMELVLRKSTVNTPANSISLRETGGGDGVAESFTIDVQRGAISVTGADRAGLRDGIVKLVDLMGFRQAPILKIGSQNYRPRQSVRLGNPPWLGSMREQVFLGYNTVFVFGGDLYSFSTSDALPELAARRVPGTVEKLADQVADARRYGLKTYTLLETRKKFAADDPIFTAHPDVRGTVTWKADGDYVLCTEHPLVQRFLEESITGIFRAAPDLSGICIIIGGEGFYHCFMRPFGVEKGHTNCPRCEKLGPDVVVANLCNRLAAAARKINPKAEIVAWPYSAVHVWSADAAQSGFIEKLKPGTAIFTEMEKDEHVTTPEGIDKHMWDYSIHMTGLGNRAKEQVALCKKVGIPIYLKSDPEITLEAPLLAHIPCMDRWLQRSEALVTSARDGGWVFTAFKMFYGSVSAEMYKHACWDPPVASILDQLAARVAGAAAAPYLRQAWTFVSDSIEHSPEQPPYYEGPYYLGPAHPMCADRDAPVPQVFYGRALYLSEMTDDEGFRLRPTFFRDARGDVESFTKAYGAMHRLLRQAAEKIDAAEPLVPQRCRLTFTAEASAVRWLYRTARTHHNFYQSCRLRDELAQYRNGTTSNESRARESHERWLSVLTDERQNTVDAIPLMEQDVRLDFRYGGDHSYSHGRDMLRAKVELLDSEIQSLLPRLWKELTVTRS